MIDLGKKNLLGVHIDAVDYEAAVERFIRAARNHQSFTTTALAVHGVMTGVQDSDHRSRLNAFDMIVPDGMPVRWGLNWLYRTRLPDRVYGPNLMLKICERAASEQLAIFLFGSDEPTLALLSKSLCNRFPALKIAGAEPSQFRTLTESEFNALAERIQRSGAQMAFVGLGCPRQEVFVYEMRSRLNIPLFAVGAAFPFHAGTLPQAPFWMQQSGLEWLFRFLSEPKRLWKRYVFLNPAYLGLLALQTLQIRRFKDSATDRPVPDIFYG